MFNEFELMIHLCKGEIHCCHVVLFASKTSLLTDSNDIMILLNNEKINKTGIYHEVKLISRLIKVTDFINLNFQ